MSDFTTVASVDDIPVGKGASFAVNGRMVAVFNVDGKFHAMDDLCPHMGASLAGGALQDGVVTCPWHAWRFSVCDGTWCDNPKLKIDTFELRVREDQIEVRVLERDPAGGETE